MTTTVSLTVAITKLAEALDLLREAQQQRPAKALKGLEVAETAIHKAASRIALVRQRDR